VAAGGDVDAQLRRDRLARQVQREAQVGDVVALVAELCIAAVHEERGIRAEVLVRRSLAHIRVGGGQDVRASPCAQVFDGDGPLGLHSPVCPDKTGVDLEVSLGALLSDVHGDRNRHALAGFESDCETRGVHHQLLGSSELEGPVEGRIGVVGNVDLVLARAVQIAQGKTRDRHAHPQDLLPDDLQAAQERRGVGFGLLHRGDEFDGQVVGDFDALELAHHGAVFATTELRNIHAGVNGAALKLDVEGALAGCRVVRVREEQAHGIQGGTVRRAHKRHVQGGQAAAARGVDPRVGGIANEGVFGGAGVVALSRKDGRFHVQINPHATGWPRVRKPQVAIGCGAVARSAEVQAQVLHGHGCAGVAEQAPGAVGIAGLQYGCGVDRDQADAARTRLRTDQKPIGGDHVDPATRALPGEVLGALVGDQVVVGEGP